MTEMITIKVGNENITQEINAKLLGVTIYDNQNHRCKDFLVKI